MSAKLIFAISVGITLAVGIGGYLLWSASPTETVENTTPKASQKKPESKPRNTSSPTQVVVKTESPSSTPIPTTHEELGAQTQSVAIKTCEPNIIFVVIQQDAKEQSFHSLDQALVVLGKAKPDATLTLAFEKCAISSIDEKIFRRFIARVGDYIFIQRMIFIEDVGEVLREPEFGRVTEDEVEKRGNVLFANVEEQYIALEIRGLVNQVKQVEIVARDMLIKAILHPETIIDQPDLKEALLSKRLAEFLSLEVKPTHVEFIDALQDSAVYDENKCKPFGLEGNLAAFLPCVDFRSAPNITTAQYEKLTKHYRKFYEDIKKKILEKVNPDIVYDDRQFIELTKTHFPDLILQVRRWVLKVELTSILQHSLFHQ